MRTEKATCSLTCKSEFLTYKSVLLNSNFREWGMKSSLYLLLKWNCAKLPTNYYEHWGAFRNEYCYKHWSTVNEKAFRNEVIALVLQRWSVQKFFTIDILLTTDHCPREGGDSLSCCCFFIFIPFILYILIYYNFYQR